MNGSVCLKTAACSTGTSGMKKRAAAMVILCRSAVKFPFLGKPLTDYGGNAIMPPAKTARREMSSNFRRGQDLRNYLPRYPMMGTIKTLRDRGFGFITPEGGEKDVFFHATEVKGIAFEDLKEGMKVTFDMADSDKGPKAVNIQAA